jgi:hypothetical protein
MPFGRPNKSGTDRPAPSGSRARFPYHAPWVSLKKRPVTPTTGPPGWTNSGSSARRCGPLAGERGATGVESSNDRSFAGRESRRRHAGGESPGRTCAGPAS